MSTNDRWIAAKNHYAAAFPLDEERRKRYLDQNCADPDLRKEVEKLLVSESTQTDVAVPITPAGKLSDVLPPGTILEHYRIQKRLGAGGMGLVYEALDQNLQRTVAIKIIQPGAIAARDRMRFLREAQSVSALNHPNIVTVYEAGQHEGLDFIAMERVHGQTLKQKIGSKGLDARTAIRYAAQIADALAAAHEAGIIHRDLKPGNVMVTDRDVVKVLDFGLAKREARAGELDESITGEGHIVGTYAYMSPEQAQGLPVDKRSDIFSFGSVLFEMLTGVKAFQQDSHVGTMAAILHKDPPPLRELNQTVPPGLTRVIEKCLQKKPHDRWQDMQDLKLVLSGMLEDLGSSPIEAFPAAAPRKHWLVPAIVAGALAVGAGGMSAWLHGQPAEVVNEPVYRMLTADNGLNDYPALSRDGKFIAFSSDRAGGDNLDIWLQQIGGREMIQLTKDPADETDPSFSPDGTHIAYRSERDGGGIYVIQALGGDPALLVRGGRNPRYSPDGKWITYWVGRLNGYVTGSSKAYIIEAGGGQPRQIHPEMSFAQFPSWSPSGDSLLVYGMKGRADETATVEAAFSELDYWVLPIQGGEPRKTNIAARFTSLKLPGAVRQIFKHADHAALDWSGHRLITPFEIGDSSNLWEWVLDNHDRTTAPPGRITRGPGRQVHGSKALTDTVERLAFSDVSENYDIWSAGIDPSGAGSPKEDTQLTHSIATEWAPSISRDGKKMVYLAQRSGSWALILRDLPGDRERVLATSSVRVFAAFISGDGSKVVYSDSGPNLLQLSSNGGEVEKLAGPRGTVMSLSNDGRLVAYEPISDEDLIVYDVEQRRSVTLTRRPGPNMILSGTRLSPDGKWVAFHAIQNPLRHTRIWIAPLNLEQPVPFQSWIPVTDENSFAQDPYWASDGLTIYFASERDGFRCFWAQRIDPATRVAVGDSYPVRHFHSARQTLRGTERVSYITGLSAAAGRLFYSIYESKGNIWLEEKNRGR